MIFIIFITTIAKEAHTYRLWKREELQFCGGYSDERLRPCRGRHHFILIMGYKQIKWRDTERERERQRETERDSHFFSLLYLFDSGPCTAPYVACHHFWSGHNLPCYFHSSSASSSCGKACTGTDSTSARRPTRAGCTYSSARTLLPSECST